MDLFKNISKNEIKECYVVCMRLENQISKVRKILTQVAKHKEIAGDKRYQENKVLRTTRRKNFVVNELNKKYDVDVEVAVEKANVNGMEKCGEKENGVDKVIVKTVVSNGDEHKGDEKLVLNDNGENADTEEDDKSDSLYVLSLIHI